MLRFALFFVMACVVWGGGHYYIGRRLIGGAPFRAGRRRAAWIVLALIAVIPIVTMASGRLGMHGPMYDGLVLSGFTLMGISSVLFFFVLTGDLLRGSVNALRAIRQRRLGDGPRDPERRRFMGKVLDASMVGGAGSLAAVGYGEATRVPRVVEVEVPLENLPPSADGFTIVQLTDVHVGPTIRKDALEEIVDRANALGGDITVVTGDLIDGYVDELRPHVAPLCRLRARYGTFFVTGNHEYYWNPLEWCEEVSRLGLTVLDNAHRVVEHAGAKILVAGVTDVGAGDILPQHASDPHKAREGAPVTDVAILLAHQPRSIYAAAEAGYDLQISGHTHGGQYFPMNLLVHLVQPYVSGLHRHGRTWIYVSRGTGYWGPPMRVGAPAEITRIRLRARS